MLYIFRIVICCCCWELSVHGYRDRRPNFEFPLDFISNNSVIDGYIAALFKEFNSINLSVVLVILSLYVSNHFNRGHFSDLKQLKLL